jgi:hypothetical protein
MHGRRGEDRLSTHLALPRQWQNVNDYLQGHDPDLRLRASVERAGLFILERRCRRRPAVNTAMSDVSDMHVQARDGFIHISTVHPEWLNKPWNILRALRDEGVDLWAYKSSEAFCDERNTRSTGRRKRGAGAGMRTGSPTTARCSTCSVDSATTSAVRAIAPT